MNDAAKDELIHELKELEDTLDIARLLAIRRIKNGDISGADEVLFDAIYAIQNIRDRFFT